MANNYFKFKQFTIIQNKAAMKVGTDGVLLGAWASCSEAKLALDIGCGTGLIALMLAQRSNANIDAIDIEEKATVEARINAEASIWTNRVNVIQTSIQDFSIKSNKKYDLIVSNPPFFENSLKAESSERSTARHTDTLATSDLFLAAKKLLAAHGKFSVIIPVDNLEPYLEISNSYGFFCKRMLWVKPTPTKLAKRVLIEFSFDKHELREDVLVLEKYGRHKYSEEYIELTKEFYLNF